MAQKVQVTYVSDLSGDPAQETVRFALDGTDYEIDLSAGESAGLRNDMAEWIAAARRKPGSRARSRSRRQGRTDLPEIREYARERGYDIKERGRVPQQIISEYDMLKDFQAR